MLKSPFPNHPTADDILFAGIEKILDDANAVFIGYKSVPDRI